MAAAQPKTILELAPRPRGRPKAEDVEALEARLVSIARQVFLEHGYGAASMAAVARAARVSKNTLYARFPSKAALFQAIMARQISSTDLVGGRGSGRARSLEATLRAYAEHMLGASLEGEILKFNRLIYSEAARFPELGEATTARTLIGIRQVAGFLTAAARSDGIPIANPQAAAHIFIMMLRGWYGDILLTNRVVTAPEVSDMVGRILTVFMASRPIW